MTTIALLALAFCVRAIAAVPPDQAVRGPALLARCALQAVAAWMLAVSTQSVVPLWPVLPAAALAALLRWKLPGRWAEPATDLALFLIVGVTAIPGLGAAMMVGGAVALALIGLALDQYARRVPGRYLTTVAMMSFVGGVITLPYLAWHYRVSIWGQTSPVAFLAVSQPHAGARVTLPTGSVAWRLEPRGTPRDTAILFLHGAHSAGAMQSTAIGFRAALVDAGYRVLSLDSMGYGASPVPTGDLRSIAVWDERPHLEAALGFLRQEMHAARIVVIGHSMGCNSAMRSLQVAPAPDRVVLFGAAMVQELNRDDYWRGRFESDRRLPPASLTIPQWKAIHHEHFDGRKLASGLPADHAPIVLVHFALDHDDVMQTRGAYAEVLPGEFRETTFTASNHYLNTTTVQQVPWLRRIPLLRDLVLLDWRAVRQLEAGLPGWIDGAL